MKITKDNYFSEIEKINVDELPEELLQAHELISDKTNVGKDWSIYHQDGEMKKVIDLTFQKLEEFISFKNGLAGEDELGATKKKAVRHSDIREPRDAAKALIMPYVLRGDDISSISKSMMGANTSDYSAYVKGGKIHVTEVNGKKVDKTFSLMDVFQDIRTEKAGLAKKGEQIVSERIKKERLKEIIAQETEKISEEVRFVRRFLGLHNKTREKKQVLSFINSLQRAMLEKRIRKASSFAKEILYIQESLLKIYNSMGAKIKIELKPNTINEFIKIAKSEKVRPSVQFIKRYISIQGKPDKVEQGARLCKALERAARKKVITKEDPFAKEVNAIWLILKIAPDQKAAKKYPIQREDLRGLFGEPAEESLGETPEEQEEEKTGDEKPQPHLMCSTEFASMEFSSIGFTGKWLELIGDPCKGFSAMVFGKPKMGKSYLSIDFAAYLATHFGKVLYVAREEKLDATLQKKLADNKAFNPDLFVSDSLPDDLSDYDFIFLDSVNKLGLTPKDIDTLREKNPGKSFICIFQTTKDGHFKGKNEFQHDVDVVIEIPERGKALQFGRFNQGGEMDIFLEKRAVKAPEEKNIEESEKDDLHGSEESVMLAGVKKDNMDKHENLPDELNPEYIFSLTATDLLVDAVNKKIDLDYYARKQLANRGLDKKGKWVGFEKAKQIHKVYRGESPFFFGSIFA